MILLLCEGQPGRLQVGMCHAQDAKNIIGRKQSCFKCGASGIDRSLFSEILVIVGFPIQNDILVGAGEFPRRRRVLVQF